MDLVNKKIRTPGISELLGGSLLLNTSIKNYYDLIILSRTGISKASAESVISFTGMSKKNFVEDILNLSIKTLERKQGDDKLDKRTSSLVIEVARVLEHTYQVFGDKEKVHRWLSKPNNALHGESPLSLFSTPTGIGMVEDVLTRIEEGVYSQMHVYRIVKSEKRTTDLSGMGAFKAGGRWNEKGTYVLYTSENSSLAFLENLVHFDLEETPEDLYILEIKVKKEELIFQIPDADYPEDWLNTDNFACKKLGDKLFLDHKLLGIKVRSAVNQSEFNLLLDPLFPGYHDLINIVNIIKIPVDQRLI